jgi:hypothetical protein
MGPDWENAAIPCLTLLNVMICYSRPCLTVDAFNDTKPWITEEEKAALMTEVAGFTAWLDEKLASQAGRSSPPRHDISDHHRHPTTSRALEFSVE